eukprot:1177256-Prorocentrum_minimum.AAC.2
MSLPSFRGGLPPRSFTSFHTHPTDYRQLNTYTPYAYVSLSIRVCSAHRSTCGQAAPPRWGRGAGVQGAEAHASWRQRRWRRPSAGDREGSWLLRDARRNVNFRPPGACAHRCPVSLAKLEGSKCRTGMSRP